MEYRIIIIDDEKEISGGFAMFFPWKSIGFTVAGQFDNAEEALTFLEEQEVDVICLDVQMPGMDGLQMAEKIQEKPFSHMPVIVFFSAYDEFRYAQKAMEYGAIKYVLKSTPYDELIAVFQDLKEKLDQRGKEEKGETEKKNADGVAQKEPEERDQVLSIIKAYTKEHMENVNLDLLAEKVYMSPAYVSRYFKQKTGQNFQDYLIELRMEKAAELLSDIRYRVGDVSEMVGYKNPFNFTRTFKKYFGETPKDYRYRRLGRLADTKEENSEE